MKMERSEGYLQDRKKLLEENQSKKKKQTKKKQTEDSREMEKEDNTDMVFDCHPSKTWKDDEKTLKNDLVDALNKAKVKSNNSRWQDSISKHAIKMEELRLNKHAGEDHQFHVKANI